MTEKKPREFPILSKHEFDITINQNITKCIVRQPSSASKPLTRETRALIFWLVTFVNQEDGKEIIIEDALLQPRTVSVWGKKIVQNFFHECLETMKVIFKKFSNDRKEKFQYLRSKRIIYVNLMIISLEIFQKISKNLITFIIISKWIKFNNGKDQ